MDSIISLFIIIVAFSPWWYLSWSYWFCLESLPAVLPIRLI